MPSSRKKDRGKQRRAAKQKGNGLASTTLPPAMQGHMNPTAIGYLKEMGCRIIRGDDGSHTIRHPCFLYIKGNTTAGSLGNFDRGRLNDDERQELARNYVHNYAQDLREGDLHGTEVIGRNVSDSHIGPQMLEELARAEIHLSMLHFLNQSDKPVSDVLGRGVDVEESIKLSHFWVALLGMLVQDGLPDDEQENVRIALARGIEPFVMAMIDGKRELFRSNHIWHWCTCNFFGLMREITRSKEAFLVMISYDGFLPFVAQASCWSQSREDIVVERELLRRGCPDPMTYPEPTHSACHEAHKALCSAIHEHVDGVKEAVMNRALDQLARTPLLSNDPECNDSTLAGLVRMMSTKSNKTDSTMVGLVRMMNESSLSENDREFLLEGIINPLLLKHGYVDDQVIAELIEYGKGNVSRDTAETVLNTMVSILGRDDTYEHIQRVDSRYAAAVRHGLLEFGFGALIEYGDESDCEIAEGLYFIAYGLCSMAMHSKTSRALRGKKAEIMKALDEVRKESVASLSDKICSLINESIEASAPATCCNCLQEIDKGKLLYCQRCNLECYCGPACQSESYALGHDKRCKEEVQFVERMKEEGLSESELKRVAVLSSNLMMNGCRYIRSKMDEILDSPVEVEPQGVEVTIDFGQCPPGIEVSRTDTGACSGSVQCTFILPVHYGFVEKVDWEEIVLEKDISRRYLASLVA